MLVSTRFTGVLSIHFSQWGSQLDLYSDELAISHYKYNMWRNTFTVDSVMVPYTSTVLDAMNSIFHLTWITLFVANVSLSRILLFCHEPCSPCYLSRWRFVHWYSRVVCLRSCDVLYSKTSNSIAVSLISRLCCCLPVFETLSLVIVSLLAFFPQQASNFNTQPSMARVETRK